MVNSEMINATYYNVGRNSESDGDLELLFLMDKFQCNISN